MKPSLHVKLLKAAAVIALGIVQHGCSCARNSMNPTSSPKDIAAAAAPEESGQTAFTCNGKARKVSTGSGRGSCKEWSPGVIVCADSDANVAIYNCELGTTFSAGSGFISEAK